MGGIQLGLAASHNELGDMVRSVSEFHDRWRIEQQADRGALPTRWLRSRSALITEENREFATARNWDNLAEEAADVLFVALGTLDLLPVDTVARAMRTVIEKNDSKTESTHHLHPETGKVTRLPAG